MGTIQHNCIIRKTGKILLWAAITVVGLLLLMITLLNIPAVQTFITGKISKMLSDQTGAQISVGAVKIAFPKTVHLSELLVEDLDKDTLLHVGSIKVNADLTGLLNNRIMIRSLQIEKLKTNIERLKADPVFNFQFILDSLSSVEPDTTPSEPWEFGIRKIHLSNFDVHFHDELSGMEARLDLGSLSLLLDAFAPDQMRFDIETVELKNTIAWFEQWEVPANGDDTSSDDNTGTGSLPEISLGKLHIANVDFRFRDKQEQTGLETRVGNLLFEPDKIELTEKNLDLGKLTIEHSIMKLAVAQSPEKAADTTKSNQPPEIKQLSDILPDWKIKMDQLKLESLQLDYSVANAPPKTDGFDPNHIQLRKLSMDLREIFSTPEGAAFDLKNLNFESNAGIDLEKLVIETKVDDHEINLEKLVLQTSRSKFFSRAHIAFNNLGQLIDKPWSAAFELQIEPSVLHLGDMAAVAPAHALDSIIRRHSSQDIQLELRAGGSLNNLTLNTLNVSTGRSTNFSASGKIAGIPDTDHLTFDIRLDSLLTTSDELKTFLPEEYFSGLNIPEHLKLQFSAEGTSDSLNAGLEFYSGFGKLTADAIFRRYPHIGQDTFHLRIDLPDFNAGKLLADTTLGKLTFRAEISGKNATTGQMSAKLDGTLDSAYYNNYHYRDLRINARMHHDTVKAEITSPDENLDFKMNAVAVLDSTEQWGRLKLDLHKIDLQALHFSGDQFVAKTTLTADINYSGMADMDARVELSDTEIVKQKNYFPAASVVIDAKTTSDSTRLKITSDYVDVFAGANLRADSLEPLIAQAFRKYISREDNISLIPGKQLQARVNFHFPDDLPEQTVPDLKAFSIDTLFLFYTSDNNRLVSELIIPKIKYSGFALDSLYVSVSGVEDSINLTTGFNQLAYDTIGMNDFRVKADLMAGRILSSISIKDVNKRPNFLLTSEMQLHKDSVRIALQPEGLMMDGNKWQVSEKNRLVIRDNSIESSGFTFKQADQKLAIVQSPDSVYLALTNFGISNLINVIHMDSRHNMIGGKINGTLSLPQQDSLAGVFGADLNIQNLKLLDSLAGDVEFVMQNTGNRTKIDISLQNPYNSFSVRGTIGGEEQNIDLKAGIDIDALRRFERFTFGQLSNMSGSVSGELEITGKTNDPEIKGDIQFNNVAFNVNSLNFYTQLNDETIRFDRTGIHFDNFSIKDPGDNPLVIDGSVLTNNFSDFRFDLQINTDRFHPINSTEQDNEHLYGDLYFSTNTSISGTSDLPVVDASLKIEKGTALTYVMPGSEIKMIEHEGIVRFAQPTIAGDTIPISEDMEYFTDSVMRKVTGIDLNAKIELDPAAGFTVIVDPASGDYATVSGAANLNYSIDQSGTQSVTGVFEVRDGYYLVSFYGLVKKKFSFQPGSNISWSGRVMDATIDFTAIHEVRTQSVALVAGETSGMTPAEQNLYQQRLPYKVLLNINGSLSEPDVSFGLDLPQKYRVNYPQIATKLNMLNSDQLNSELNKQVFALLVTGSFIAENPFAQGGGGPGIATTAARNSVNGILSAQLNKLSEKYVKGFNINFDLNTYEDYSTGTSQTRTELDVEVQKKFFDDRLTIEASSSFDVEGDDQPRPGQTSQQLYGEFAVTYDLTESGDYKLRAYRENAYDIFDGEVAYSGVAFILQKSFNHFRMLFRKQKPNQEAIEEEKGKTEKSSEKTEQK